MAKLMTAMRLPPELIKRMDAWCEKQRPPAKKAALMQMLLEDFFAKEDRARAKKNGAGLRPQRVASRINGRQGGA